jgi:hypothetical protein
VVTAGDIVATLERKEKESAARCVRVLSLERAFSEKEKGRDKSTPA